MARVDLVFRLLIVASILFSSFPPASAWASPGSQPRYQTEEPTVTPTATEMVGVTPTDTAAPPETSEPTPTETATVVPPETSEPTPTETETALPAPSETATLPQETGEPTPTETATPAGTGEPTPTGTALPQETATLTATVVLTPAETATPTPSATATLPVTSTSTVTPTFTPTLTPTLTVTPTATPGPIALTLSMSADPPSVLPGDFVTVTLTLTNPGQLDLDNLSLSTTLPAELSYFSGVGGVPASYNPLLHLVTWDLPADWAGQSSLTVSYVAQVTAGAPATTLTLAAEAIRAGSPVAGAQTALLITSRLEPTATPFPVGPPATLQLGLEPGPGEPDQGRQRRWGLTVYVVDADGLAVADGTEVQLNIQGGSLAGTTLQTRHGAAATQLVAQPGQSVTLTAQAGPAQASWQADPGATANLLPAEFRRESERYGPARALVIARNALNQQGSDLVAENFSRRVAFNQAGLTFTLKGDRDTAKHASLDFQLTGVQVGQTSLLTGQPELRGSGNWAHYRLANERWQVAYEAGDATVEQYFLFEKGIPTGGDLVIEGRFQTALEPELISDEAGVQFRRPAGEGEALLAFGPALVSDAQGRQMTARLELQNRQLRLIIPADWLAGAEFPVLVDPLLGPAELVSGLTGAIADPAVASDGSSFLSVWSWQGDIYGQLVDSTGTLTGSLITISQADGSQAEPEISYNAAAGEYLVVWTDHRYGLIYNTLRGQRLNPAGQLQGSELDLLSPTQGALGPAVAAAGAGDYLLVWSDQSSGNRDIYGRLLTASGALTGAKLTLSSASGIQTTPAVAYDSGANLFQVVWSDRRDGSAYDIFGQQVTATGGLSGSNQQMSGDTESQNLHRPAVAANGSSQFLLAWEKEVSSSNYDIEARLVLTSSGWITGSLLTLVNESGAERYPAVTGTNGDYLVLWRNDGLIEARQVTGGGSLGNPETVSASTSGVRSLPAIAYSSGQSLGVWTDTSQSGQAALLTGRRIANTATPSGDEIFISPYSSRRERVALTPNPGSGSGFLLAWEQAASSPTADIFVQPLTNQGLAAGNPVNLTQHAAPQERPALATGQNGYLATWRDGRDEGASGLDIYGQLLTGSGIPTGSLIAISTAVYTQSNPAAAYNSSQDEYLVIWDDYRGGGEPDIHGQLLDSAGTPGAAFTLTLTGRQAFPDVTYNPDQNRYLAVWEDDNGGSQHDIYGQVISPDGSLVGSKFAIASASGDQFDAVVAYHSGSQSYLVAWWDRRSGTDWDIYGQLITGTSSLSGSNFAISTASSNQEYPALAVRPGSAPGEFLVLWQDQRASFNRDLYGQRVSASGALLDEPDTGADETDPTVNLPFDTGSGYTERPAVTYQSQAAVYLAAWNNRSDGGVYTRRYTPSTPPTAEASFSAAPLSGVIPLTVTFTDTSSGTITNRSWDFGDSTPLVVTTSVVLTHTYLATGTFTAILTVTNPAGSAFTSTLITVTEQITPALSADFEALDLGSDPAFWLDQLWDTTGRDDFETLWAGDSRALATTYTGNVVYSHYAIPGRAGWQNYEYQGRLKMSDPGGGIGVALLSRYPANQQSAYVLRRYAGSAATEQFHLAAFGTSLQGDTNLDLTPQANTWYRFRIQAVTGADRVTLRAKVWAEGETEPLTWPAEAYDASATRLTAGAVGVRTQGAGTKYFDNLLVTPLAVQADFSAPVRSGFAPFSPVFTATPLGQVLTYTWNFGDGSSPVVTTSVVLTHTYTEVGSYEVSLAVEGPSGTDTLTRPVYITVADLATGLRGYWPLEEASGQRLDSSGYGNHLTETNTVASATGQAGQAADLERSNSEYLSIDHTLQTGLAITGSLTLAGWVNLESLNQDVIVASKYEFGVNNRAYRLDIRSDNKPAFIVSPDGTTSDDYNLVASTTLTAGTWSHLAAVFDAQTQTMALYLDGTPVATRSVTYDQIYASTAPFMLGANLSSGSPTQFFDGLLDEWRVYARALSQGEIAGLMAATAPTVAFSATPLTGTAPLTVTFSNETAGPATYLWDFGDSLTSTLVNPGHVYTQAGLYTVTLTATGPGGSASLTRTNYITVSSAISAAFAATPLTGAAPLTVTFSSSSTGASSYLWDFGDGNTGTEITPTHVYTGAGVYTVTLSAGDGVVTDTLTRTHYITVTPPLAADFSAFPITGPPPLLIQFFDNSTGASSYLWDFGDGLTATIPSPTHTYTAAGVYTVSLTVSDGVLTDTLVKPNFITVTEAVVADFSAETLTGTVPLTVTFSNSSSGANSYLWGFGDGHTSTEISPTHVYTQAGIYTVFLSASDGFITDTLTKTHYITVAEIVVANFSADPLTGTVPLTVTFTNSSAGATDYWWDFGDGITDTVINPVHVYTQAGVYTVSLTASGLGGSDSLTRTNYITVFEAVVASFIAEPLTGTVPLTVTFSNNSVGTDSYLWDFGDGATSAEISPTHVYTGAGVYTVSLAATGPGGSNTLTQTNYITAIVPVVADFSADPLTGTLPLTVTFTNSSTGASSYYWNFGDGLTSTEISPTHLYTQAGVYTVTLAASNDLVTETLTRTDYITVSKWVVAGFSAEPLTGTMPLTVTFSNSSTNATDYLWNFGDGITSTVISPTHIYTQAGIYTVTLAASNGVVTDTLTRIKYITVTSSITRDWQLISTATSPLVRGEHGMVYDSARQVVILYGGNAAGWPYEDSTWEFDGIDWSLSTATLSPEARYGVGLAYDSVRGVTVLFGGSSANDLALNQTWEYTGTTWTQRILTTTVPASRTYASMTADPASGTIYLFGGNDGETYYNDVWQYENGSWSEIAAGGNKPAERTLTGLAYDASNDRLLIFGGRSMTGTVLADFWAFDLNSATWTQLTASGDGPPGRQAHTLTYEPTTGQVILIGGATEDGSTLLADTWHYQDGWTAATPLTTLPAQAYHQAVSTGNTILLFAKEETWKYE